MEADGRCVRGDGADEGARVSEPYYNHGGIQIYHGDCREILPELRGDVAVVFTSPPYAEQRDYTARTDWDATVPSSILSAAQGTAQVFVNLGLVHRDGRVREYWRPLIDAMDVGGLPLFGWYVWDQGCGLPGDWNGRLAPSFEFVFHFTSQTRRAHKTKPCRNAGKVARSRTFRQRDGSTKVLHGADRPYGDTKIPDSVIRVPRFQRNPATPLYMLEHPAPFPVGLPAEFIAAYSDPGEIILDPFMGSGTTLRAAKDLGRKAIGIEIEERYCEIAAKRLAQEVLPFEAQGVLP